MSLIIAGSWPALIGVIVLSLIFYKLTKSKWVFLVVFVYFVGTRFTHLIPHEGAERGSIAEIKATEN